MKTKIFKTGLPIMAFLMAIGLAFATESKVGDEELLTGYIWNNDRCVVDRTQCNNVPSTICKTSGMQTVYKGDTETVCSEVLFHTL